MAETCAQPDLCVVVVFVIANDFTVGNKLQL